MKNQTNQSAVISDDALEVTARILKVAQVTAIAFAIAQLSIVLAIAG